MQIDRHLIDRYRRWARSSRQHSLDEFVFYYRVEGKRPNYMMGHEPEEFEAYIRIRFGSYMKALTNGVSDVAPALISEFLLEKAETYGWTIEVDALDESISALARTLSQQMAADVAVYAMRISQCPLEAVHRTWYNDIDEFLAWSDLVMDCLESDPLDEGQRFTSLRPLIPTIAIQDRRQRRITDDAIASVTSGGGEPAADASDPSTNLISISTARVEKLLDRIVQTVSAVMARDAMAWETALHECLVEVRDAFGLRIVDMLVVDRKSRLSIVATSWGDIAPLQEIDLYYQEGVGVTGSVFLLRDGADSTYGSWVGTPLVDSDDRSSVYHRKHFESEYKRVTSFWVFPIGDPNGGLRGALRAIDLAPAAHGEPVDWPFTMRLELSAVATSMGRFLSMLDRSVMGASLPDPAFDAAQELVGAGIVDSTVPSSYLTRLLYRLSQFASAKYEHRAVSCTLVVVEPTDLEHWKSMSPYPAVPAKNQNGRLAEAVDLLSQVVPGAGVFVCRVEGVSSGDPIELSYSGVVETKALDMGEVSRQNSNRASLFIELDGERDRVRLFREGKFLADYYLDQKVGRWKLRILSLIVDELTSPAFCPESIPPEVLERVLALVWAYSYDGNGGMIVVSDRIPRDKVQKKGFRVEININPDASGQLSRVLAVDGGVHVETRGNAVAAGILFKSDRSPDDDHAIGGSRHATASYLQTILDESVIFVISANRQVTIHSTKADKPIVF